ncbi:MAG: NAD(P)H-hydrate epimerase [Phycisphaerales bacterium]|nr:NAD(P)H-hydrate epimerase [Phycisphaerales bacterium]
MPLTRAQARAFDQHAVRDLGVPEIVLMENAARGCAEVAVEMLAAAAASGKASVLIVCGAGQNGGDGYALARHLLAAGHRPQIAAIGAPRNRSPAAINANTCKRLGVEIVLEAEAAIDRILNANPCRLIVDALLGTGVDRPVDGDMRRAINAINARRQGGVPVLSIDLPSGLDPDSGLPLGDAVRATMTATMVAPKIGFACAGAAAFTGLVTVVSIGVPPPC